MGMQRVNGDNPHATSNHSNVANSRKLDSVVPSCLNERIVGSNTLKRSGSPFKPPLFREATNPLESRKERQIKFRKKIQKARDVLKSFYCEPGIATEVNKVTIQLLPCSSIRSHTHNVVRLEYSILQPETNHIGENIKNID